MAWIVSWKYSARCDGYVNAMTDMFKQIPLTKKNSYTKTKGIETHDRYWWWKVHGKKCQGTITIEENQTK